MTLRRKVIAIVDNDPSVLEGIDSLLRGSGYLTELYCSAEAFLDAATVSEVTCLVLDIQLDGMSGIELRHRLTASGSNLPTIFMTGCEDDEMCKRAIEAGCVTYLQKPFRADFLLDAIDKAGH